MGLYYSTDSGVTWQMARLLDGAQVLQRPSPTATTIGNAATAVVWNPVRQLFFAAIRNHGYYQSPDGATWTRMPNQPGGAALSLTACPTNPVTTASGCPIFRGALAVQSASGDTFALTTDANNRDTGLFQDLCSLSGSGCASATPTFSRQLASAPMEIGSGSTVIPQADYNLALAAQPASNGTTDTVLFAGTADLFRCALSSSAASPATTCVLRNTTNTADGCASPALVAPAQHALALGGGNAPVLFLGNDGGVWRSLDLVNQQANPCSADDSTHFQNLNAGLGSLAEVVSFAQSPTDPSVLLAGLGASGTVSTGRSDATAWQQLSSGEGGSVAIDPSNPALWYLSTAAGISIASCANGAACTAADFAGPADIGAAQLAGDLALQDAPWMLDPALPANLLAGTCRIWRGPALSPALWSASDLLSPALAGAQPASIGCSTSNPFIAAIAAGGPVATAGATGGSSVLYAGMAGRLAGGLSVGGHLFSASAATFVTPSAAWTDLARSPVLNDPANAGVFNASGFTLPSVVADPHDATGHTVYATVQGFSGNGITTPHVYGSTDGGAHWTNLSANLPNAPANALVVDPNDANTVYVALDIGVYATTQITTCASSNCWSLYGTSLPNTPVTALAASASLPTGDGRLGLLRAGTYGRGLWQIPLLTAATIQQPAMTLSPAALTFPSTGIGSASVAQTITVTNTGNAPLAITRVAITSNNAATGVTLVVTDFTATGTCVGSTLAVNATCSLAVSFSPSAAGARSSTLTLLGNVPGGQATLSLAGTGLAAPAISLTPTSIVFPTTPLASTSAAQNVVIANTGGTTLSLGAITLAGSDFLITANTCGTSLASQSSCTVALAFRGSATGTRTGTLSVTDALGTQTVSLSGVAAAPATDALSTFFLSFGATEVGSPSPAQGIVLTNAGDVPLTLIATSVTSTDFTATNSCGNSLLGHSACVINVAFTPHAVGSSSAVLTIADEFRNQIIAISGTGIAPPGVSLLPSGTISFPTTGVGQASAAQLLTLTNNGGLPLVVSSITPSGDFALAAQGSTCGASLAPSTACTLAVVFSPTVTGARTGSLTVVSNAPNSPQTVLLNGTGIDFTLNSDNTGTSLTVASGRSVSFPLLLSSPAGLAGTASLTCSGVPANATCVLNPTAVPLGSTQLVVVTVATGVSSSTAAATSGPRPQGFGPQMRSTHPQAASPDLGRTQLPATLDRLADLRFATLASLLPLGLLALRRRSRRPLPSLLAVVLGVFLAAGGLSGCGSSPREIPGNGTGAGGSTSVSATPTPAGTYTLVVTASTAGLSRSINLTLTVQ